MGDIVKFPTVAMKEWREMQHHLQAFMDSKNIPYAAQKRIASGMKAFCDEINFSHESKIVFSYPLDKLDQNEVSAMVTDINGKIEAAIRDGLDKMLVKLGAERFERELDFCRTLGLL